jgi:uncharacterized protein with HEPN domain
MKTDKLTVEQILEFIKKIETYIDKMTFDDFEKDYKTQDAVIRNIELIGEAANHLSTSFGINNKAFPLNKAISMRNRLIHGYDDIDLKIVWKTIKNDINELKQSL